MRKLTLAAVKAVAVASLLLILAERNSIISLSKFSDQTDMQTIRVQQILTTAELVTTKVRPVVTVNFQQHTKLLGQNITTTTYTYLAVAEVAAGVDLSAAVVQKDGESIIVSLPSAQITSVEILPETRVIGYKKGFLSSDITPEAHQENIAKTIPIIRSAACEAKILELAASQAQTALSDLLDQAQLKAEIKTTPSPQCQ